MTMQRHFVTFLSPGTFVSETTEMPIDSWNVDVAVKMATDLVERHAARPYGFRFTTRGRKDDELDSRVIGKSGIYYLGGKVETAEEIFARDDPKEDILRSNIRANNIKRIVTNTNSWRFTAELNDDDVVLNVTLPPMPKTIIRAQKGRCVTCGSPAPHIHPAVQHGGEVEVCDDAYHLAPTPQNRSEYIEAVQRKRAARKKGRGPACTSC